jgi:hypothetical protein
MAEYLKITKYKIQITNKSQSQNYKLQTKRSPSGKNFIRLRRETQNVVFYQAR